MDFVDKIMELRILLASTCDGFDNSGKTSIFSTKLKVLFLLETRDCAPKDFVNELCLAKSNVANLLGDMCREKLVESYRTENNSKNIYYTITSYGREKIKEYKMNLHSRFKDMKDMSLTNDLQSIINILKGINKND